MSGFDELIHYLHKSEEAEKQLGEARAEIERLKADITSYQQTLKTMDENARSFSAQLATARDAALEEAAVTVESAIEKDTDQHDRNVVNLCATFVRALKGKKP